MPYSYQEKVKLARAAKVGDTWTNIKTGRTATIVERRSMDVKLQHEGGRVTWKQDHYFAGDFEPGSAAVKVSAPAPATAPNTVDNFDYCVSILRETSAKIRVSRKTGIVSVDIRADLQVEFTPSQMKQGAGMWQLRGGIGNRRQGVRNLEAYIKAHGA